MKKVLFLLMALFMALSYGNAQKLEFQIGAKTMHEVHVNSLISLSESGKMGIGVSYYIAFADELFMDQGGIVPVEYLIIGLNQKGFGVSMFFKGKSKKKANRWSQYTIEYQRLSSGNYIRDEGKHGGSSQEPYQEFTEKYHNISLMYSSHIMMGTSNKWELVLDFGGTLKFVERSYTIDGNYSNKNPSDKVENLISGAPVIRFGFNYKL